MWIQLEPSETEDTISKQKSKFRRANWISAARKEITVELNRLNPLWPFTNPSNSLTKSFWTVSTAMSWGKVLVGTPWRQLPWSPTSAAISSVIVKTSFRVELASLLNSILMVFGSFSQRDSQKMSHLNFPMATAAIFPIRAPSSTNLSIKNTWTTNTSSWIQKHYSTTQEPRCRFSSKLTAHTRPCSYQQQKKNKKQQNSTRLSTTHSFWRNATSSTISKIKLVSLRDLKWRGVASWRLSRFFRAKYFINIWREAICMSVTKHVPRWLWTKSTCYSGRDKIYPTMTWYRICRNQRCWARILRNMIGRREWLWHQPRDWASFWGPTPSKAKVFVATSSFLKNQ